MVWRILLFLPAKNPLHDVFYLCWILALQLLVLFLLALDFYLGCGGDMSRQLRFGICLAFPLGRDFLVGRAILLLLDGVAFETSALAGQAFCRCFVDRQRAAGQSESRQGDKKSKGAHTYSP